MLKKITPTQLPTPPCNHTGMCAQLLVALNAKWNWNKFWIDLTKIKCIFLSSPALAKTKYATVAPQFNTRKELLVRTKSCNACVCASSKVVLYTTKVARVRIENGSAKRGYVTKGANASIGKKNYDNQFKYQEGILTRYCWDSTVKFMIALV